MKTQAERFRVRFWLAAVRTAVRAAERAEMAAASNYQLDMMFSTSPGSTSAERRREFDNIEASDKPPREEVLLRAAEKFPETLRIYNASFWADLDAEPSLAEQHEKVEQLLLKHGLVRMNWTDAEAIFGGVVSSREGAYYDCLKFAAFRLVWFESWSLLLALFKEAHACRNFLVAEVIQRLLDTALDSGCSSLLPFEKSQDAYFDLIQLSLKSAAHPPESTSQLSCMQERTWRPILPKDIKTRIAPPP